MADTQDPTVTYAGQWTLVGIPANATADDVLANGLKQVDGEIARIEGWIADSEKRVAEYREDLANYRRLRTSLDDAIASRAPSDAAQ